MANVGQFPALFDGRLNTSDPLARDLIIAVPGHLWGRPVQNFGTRSWVATSAKLGVVPGPHGLHALAATGDGALLYEPHPIFDKVDGPLTMSAWLYLNTTTSKRHYILSRRESNDAQFSAQANNRNLASWRRSGSSWHGRESTGDLLTAGQWCHCVWRWFWTGSNYSSDFFVDGQYNAGTNVFGSETGAANVDSTWYVLLGAGQSGNSDPPSESQLDWDLDGSFADVRLYNRTLTDRECRALFEPATRFSIYRKPGRIGKAPATGIQSLTLSGAIASTSSFPTHTASPQAVGVTQDAVYDDADGLFSNHEVALAAATQGLNQSAVHDDADSIFTDTVSMAMSQDAVFDDADTVFEDTLSLSMTQDDVIADADSIPSDHDIMYRQPLTQSDVIPSTSGILLHTLRVVGTEPDIVGKKAPLTIKEWMDRRK